MTLQLALLLWAVGVAAAVPTAYELQLRYTERDGDPHHIAITAVALGSLLWPVALVALLIHIIRKAVGR